MDARLNQRTLSAASSRPFFPSQTVTFQGRYQQATPDAPGGPSRSAVRRESDIRRVDSQAVFSNNQGTESFTEHLFWSVENQKRGDSVSMVAHNWPASRDKTANSAYYPFRCTTGTSTSLRCPTALSGQTANRRSTVSVLRQQVDLPRWKLQTKTVLCMEHRKSGRIKTSC